MHGRLGKIKVINHLTGIRKTAQQKASAGRAEMLSPGAVTPVVARGHQRNDRADWSFSVRDYFGRYMNTEWLVSCRGIARPRMRMLLHVLCVQREEMSN